MTTGAATPALRPGDIFVHAASEDPDVGLELQLSSSATLYAGEISRRLWQEGGGEEAGGLGGDCGWWIALYDRDEAGEGRVTLIGKACDREKAEALLEAISAAIRSAWRRS